MAKIVVDRFPVRQNGPPRPERPVIKNRTVTGGQKGQIQSRTVRHIFTHHMDITCFSNFLPAPRGVVTHHDEGGVPVLVPVVPHGVPEELCTGRSGAVFPGKVAHVVGPPDVNSDEGDVRNSPADLAQDLLAPGDEFPLDRELLDDVLHPSEDDLGKDRIPGQDDALIRVIPRVG